MLKVLKPRLLYLGRQETLIRPPRRAIRRRAAPSSTLHDPSETITLSAREVILRIPNRDNVKRENERVPGSS